ncbi:MAG TPA: dTDP-4-dehydrorhamnose reductase [Vicinamibacterales bacterium]
MRYLVTGAAGQLGSTFVQRLARDGVDVVALTRAQLDLTDDAQVRATVARERPDVILNCAAYNAVDAAEDDAAGALAVNAFGVHSLARAAMPIGARLVHYSTDFVFDGFADRPYTEADPANPRSVYGQSKLVGEWLALTAPGALVLRVESLFGGPAARSSIDRIAAALRAGESPRVFVDRVVTPSFVDDVVEATLQLLTRDAAPGVYHCVNSGVTTWHGLGEVIARTLGVEPRLTPVKVADVPMRAPRPQYCALSNAKLAAAGVTMPPWEDAIARYLSRGGPTLRARA